MAEVILKIGDVSPDPVTYSDGDIICAFNRRQIRCLHADVICKPQAFTRDGLRVNDSLSEKWYQHTHQYRFTRVSTYELKREQLSDGRFEILSNVANAARERIHVPTFIRRRLRHPGHRIFGSPGAEVWYGGKKDMSHAALDLVWADIEAGSAYVERNHVLWPLTRLEKSHFLVLTVDDFNDEESSALVRSETIEEVDPDDLASGDLVERLIQKRTKRVRWRDLSELSGGTKTDADDRGIEVDGRATATPLVRSLIVEDRAAIKAAIKTL